jgi:indole-3-glycerol phosphate synthase
VGVLAEMLDAKRRSLARLPDEPLPAPPPRRAVELGRPPGAPLRLMCEIKHRSPSAGPLSRRLTVAERVRAYERAGARMVSVLCDEEFFGGSFADLGEARRATELPLLCKDYVLGERQLDLARAWGADSVLLIARCLGDRLGQLVDQARARELEPLVEVFTEEEAAAAIRAGALLVGVNARDLDSLAIDRERAARVLGSLPPAVTAIHFSGLATPADIARVARSRADAALVGEALMREDDPEPLLGALVAAALASAEIPG